MASLIVLCLGVLYANSFDSLEKKAVANAADCAFLGVENCSLVAACMVKTDGTACELDPCFERKVTTAASCAANCERYNSDTLSFCVTPARKSSISSVCGFEFGDTKLVEEAACKTLSGCDTVTPIEVSSSTTYFVCNPAPAPTDPCNSLTEEICPYIGKCMWEGGQCVADSCWEKTYSTADDCKSGCTRKLITTTGGVELGYCKTGDHDLNNKCNAGTGSNFLTKNIACTGYPCDKIVTINNYEGDTLYVCNDVEGEFTVPDAGLSLRISSLALFAIILLTFFL